MRLVACTVAVCQLVLAAALISMAFTKSVSAVSCCLLFCLQGCSAHERDDERLVGQTGICHLDADMPPGIDTGDLLPPPPPLGGPPGGPRPPGHPLSQQQQRLRPNMNNWGPAGGPAAGRAPDGPGRKREYGSAFPDQGMPSAHLDDLWHRLFDHMRCPSWVAEVQHCLVSLPQQ